MLRQKCAQTRAYIYSQKGKEFLLNQPQALTKALPQRQVDPYLSCVCGKMTISLEAADFVMR